MSPAPTRVIPDPESKRARRRLLRETLENPGQALDLPLAAGVRVMIMDVACHPANRRLAR